MKKFGYCMLALVPLIVSVCLQIASSALLFFYHAFRILLTGSPAGTLGLRDLFLSILESIGSRTYSTEVSLCFAMLGILVFGVWYRRLCHSGTDDVFFSCFSIHHVAALVLLVPGLQIVSSMVTAVTSSMFPSAMDYYENLMQSSGLTDSPSATLILYAVFLGPIGEELTFRGVTLSFARKGLPFWAANILQAVLFGIFHLNVIQGIYAFFIGLCLGYVCHTGQSIFLSMLLHMLFNGWATFMPQLTAAFPGIYSGLMIPLYLLLLFPGFALLKRSR